MDNVCIVQRISIAHRCADERVARRWFFGMAALLFVISAVLTIHCCVDMPMGETPMPGGWTVSALWQQMCGKTPLDAARSFLTMWMAMMVTMMLPSLTPALWRYYESVHQLNSAACRKTKHHCESRFPILREGVRLRAFYVRMLPMQLTAIVSLGYFLMWALLGAIVYLLGIELTMLIMRSPWVAAVIPMAAGVIVLLAGVFQLTRWRLNLLADCREAPHCHAALDQWFGAWRYGVRIGLHGCCCCAGLTAIMLIVGIMNLQVMVLATMAITAERLVPNVGRVVGVVIVTVGMIMVGRATVFV